MKHNILYKRLAMLFFTIIMTSIVFAQNQLTEQIKRRAAEKVGQMNDYISFMANKNKKANTRLYYKKKALNLFVGCGESYEEDGVRKEGVQMEVTSIKRKTKSRRLMKTYFQSLIDLGYSQVNITSTDIADIKVSQLQKIGENLFVCTCYFEQAFIGYQDGRPIYKDITRKHVKCYVFAEETENGTELMILLGDVTADETRKL